MIDTSLNSNLIKKQFFCFFLFLPSFVFCQNNLEGYIKDTNNTIITGANIILIKNNNIEIITYTISNNKGYFKLMAKTGVYILKISYLGYKTVSISVEIKESDLQLNVLTLTENNTELEEVIIKAENNGIVQKGDVTQYKIDKFLNGTEENLKDIITKLPGLGINEDGKITANGKVIDRLLIDGENLYKTQHQLATENINSEMVQDAELIRNYKDFESISQNDKTGITALNINIKDEFKNKFTGNIETHLGISNKYKIKAALFNFNKKIKFSLIPSANNLGESTMSVQDYYALTDTDARNNSRGESKVTFSKLNDLPRFLNENNKVKSLRNNFITVSSIANISKKTKIDFYGIFNNSKQHEFNEREVNYSSNQFQINENNAIKETNYFGVFQLKSIFKPNKDAVITFNNHLNIDNSSKEKEISSASNNIREHSKPKKTRFNSEIIYNKNINSNIFSTSLSFNYLQNNNEHVIRSNNAFLNIDFNTNDYVANQSVNKVLRETNYNVNYTLYLNKVSINVYNTTNFSNNNFTSNTNNLQDYFNDLSLNSFLAKNGVDLTIKLTKKTNYTVGTNYNYIIKNLNNFSNKKNYLGYNTSLKTVFSSNNIAQLSYNYSSAIATIDYLTNGFLIKDYRNLIRNENVFSSDLLPYHQIGASHFIFKPKTKFSYIFNASYNIKEKSIGDNIINQENVSISRNKIIHQDNFFNSFIFIDKKFKKIPYSFSGSISYNNNSKEYFQDNIAYNFRSENISSIIKVASQFKKSIIHFNIGYKYSKDNFKDQTNKSFLIVSQPYLNLNGKIKKNLFWYINSNYTVYKNQSTERNIFNISPRLRFTKEKSKWEFYLTGNNILNLNNKSIIENNSSPSFIEEKTTSILDGYILLGSKLKF
ncbi:carboxypeptidase-like regulatory domain-containing protein [Bizionia argentinensis JUB59]|uniref:Carboxypeptidase-like regulatory domain-containing protein n=1 Tax=Bizionia argentinensis JUB59 TaxID=1046627 RepID=G2EDM0_9FLAO|nr:carboxypeptidase-like regulatory domain-containing protein [Bizionia argentinensis]EGV43489.1 carboxypeptidase-like regulatory domain-containing protein [Bizionia argentinensis JUB59]